MSSFDPRSPAPDGAAADRAQIERLARKRAGAKMGWYVHALVYVCVNAGLALISMSSDRPWFIFPLAGWGLGLAIHGLVVWINAGGARLHERLLQAEREKLRNRPL